MPPTGPESKLLGGTNWPGAGFERPAAAPGAPPAGGGINFPGGTGRRALAEGLEGLPIVKPPYGVPITKTLVVVGDPQFTAPAGRARGAMLRAYDKQTGAQLAEVLLPAPIVGMPMTYSLAGRQYIVVGVSGGNYTGEYISLAPALLSCVSYVNRKCEAGSLSDRLLVARTPAEGAGNGRRFEHRLQLAERVHRLRFWRPSHT